MRKFLCGGLAIAILLTVTARGAAPEISIAPAVQVEVPTEPNLHYQLLISSGVDSTWVPADLTRHGHGMPLHFTVRINPFAPRFSAFIRTTSRTD